MDAVYNFDVDDDNAPVVDLDEHLAAQFGSGARVTSQPVFTELVGTEVALTIIAVTANGRRRYQTYAVIENGWSLVAIHGNYTDALSTLVAWRRYLASGYIVAEWQLNHPDGVTPERKGF
jgi:hypothetical protein